jgi:hypothetical protein
MPMGECPLCMNATTVCEWRIATVSVFAWDVGFQEAAELISTAAI